MPDTSVFVFHRLRRDGHLVPFNGPSEFATYAPGPLIKFNSKWTHHAARRSFATISVRAYEASQRNEYRLIAYFFITHGRHGPRMYSYDNMTDTAWAMMHHTDVHIKYGIWTRRKPDIRNHHPGRHGIVANGIRWCTSPIKPSH